MKIIIYFFIGIFIIFVMYVQEELDDVKKFGFVVYLNIIKIFVEYKVFWFEVKYVVRNFLVVNVSVEDLII